MSNTDHLGILLGDANSDRIIAVSTSAVFQDRTLLPNYWGIESNSIDTGFQGHMYSRPNDILVIQAPFYQNDSLEILTTSLDLNHRIWKSLTGLELATGSSRIIVASNQNCQPSSMPPNVSWHEGSLTEAAVKRHVEFGESIIAFVFDRPFFQLLQKSKLNDDHNGDLRRRSEICSLLMDKNSVAELLQKHKVPCPITFPMNHKTDLTEGIKRSPIGRFIFKPAGGAAGIGVFGLDHSGVSLEKIQGHLNHLREKDKLPNRFQIQEFVRGDLLGVTGYGYEDKSFEIFEIHQQIMDSSGRFCGGSWNPTYQAQQLPIIKDLYKRLVAIQELPFTGQICMDVIDGKIIEINPRLTATVPIAHVLRNNHKILAHLGGNVKINKIDLNTRINVPFDLIKEGTLFHVINSYWKTHNVLILPQGINPFGNSRFLFINDDQDKVIQQQFIEELGLK